MAAPSLPEIVVFEGGLTRRIIALLFFLGIFVFVAVALLDLPANMTPRPKAIFIIVLSGLMIPVTIWSMLPGRTQLILSRSGFAMRSVLGTRDVKWTDIEKPAAGSILFNKVVSYQYRPGRRGPLFSLFNLINWPGTVMPSNYGVARDDLLYDIVAFWQRAQPEPTPVATLDLTGSKV